MRTAHHSAPHDAGLDGPPVCEGEADSRQAPLLPAGEHRLGFLHHETATMFGKAAKLILWFRVIDEGPYFGAKVARYYNVKRLIGKAGRGGRFVVKPRGDFLVEFATLFRPRGRLDRISLAPLRENIVVGRIVTVETTSRQKRTPESMHYSVVAELVRVA